MKHLIVHCGFTSTETLRLIQDGEPRTHTPSIAFRHLPPNSARFSYATEGALLNSLLRCLEEGRGVVIFIVAFHSGAVVVWSRGVGVVNGIPVTASSSLPSRAAVMLLDAVSGVALMLSASPGTASLEVRG